LIALAKTEKKYEILAFRRDLNHSIE